MTDHMIRVTHHNVHTYIWKIIIWHLYILQSEHHQKSITIHLTPSTHFAHSQPLYLLVNTSLIPMSLFSLLCFVKFNIWVKSYDICLCLTYVTCCDSLQAHPCCYRWHYFIIFNGLVILHICTTSSLFISLVMDI